MNPVQEIITNPVALRAGLGVIEGLGFVAMTTILNHRETTHESIETNPLIGYIGDVANMMTGTVSRIWARIHLKHHAFTDANLLPLKQTSDYLEWRSAHPEEALEHPALPEFFPARVLDPAAGFNLKQIVEIGKATDEIVLNRKTGEKVKDRYDRPQTYTKVEADALLDTITPRYFYAPRPSLLRRLRGAKRVVEIAPERSLAKLAPELRDPHSPALHENGVWGILRQGIGLYRDVVTYENQQEEVSGGPVEDGVVRRFEHKPVQGAILLFGGNILVSAALGLIGDDTAATVGRDIALGTLPSLIAFGMYMAGSNIVNALGHAGKYVWRTLLGRRPQVKESDGTLTSNSALAGIFTLDEAGAQEPHHEVPGLIAFSTKKGLGKIVQAPFGTVLEFLSKRHIGVRPGKQFNHAESSQQQISLKEALSDDAPVKRFQRPDEPVKPVLLIQGHSAATRSLAVK